MRQMDLSQGINFQAIQSARLAYLKKNQLPEALEQIRAIPIVTEHRKEHLRVSFEKITNDLDRQTSVLKTYISFMDLMVKMPLSITFQYCAVLNTNVLNFILHQDLEYLDLRYCPQIKNSDLKTIQRRCPNLKELHLSGCEGLTAVVDEGYLSNSPLTFSCLKVLSIDQCPNLKEVRLKSPCLEKVCGNDNPKLIFVELVILSNITKSFEKCPNLDSSKILLRQNPVGF